MIVRLLSPDRDYDPKASPDPDADILAQDLGLDVLFAAMAAGDDFLLPVVRSVVRTSLHDPEVIRYRQEVLTDGLEHPATLQELYGLSVEAVRCEREVWGFGNSPESVLYRSTRLLELLLPVLRKLRSLAMGQRATFHSAGFTRFFDTVERELDEVFFSAAVEYLAELRFPHGTFLSARLGPGNRGSDFALRLPPPGRRRWTERLFGLRRSPFTFELSDHDEAGRRALSELVDRGIASTALALSRATAHIVDFFATLRAELGFYVGCANLRSRLAAAGLASVLPTPRPVAESALSAEGLYDVCLALTTREPVVANSVETHAARLVVITGANQGGKSTFLRSLGVSLLLLHCGMFVPARRMTASVGHGLFTHFKREEDATMRGGKLDEELRRMSHIVERIRPGCFLLLNESFASTNEREGSEIAEQIVRALLESRVRVFYVTHLYDLATRLEAQDTGSTLFLRAERTPDGHRTFRMQVGPPLSTSFGDDLYREVFGSTGEGAPRPSSAG